MAKKVRRVKKGKKAAVATESVSGEKAGKVVEAKESYFDSIQQENYYVVKDLRRVLLLSSAMFLLLIVLNLLFQV